MSRCSISLLSCGIAGNCDDTLFTRRIFGIDKRDRAVWLPVGMTGLFCIVVYTLPGGERGSLNGYVPVLYYLYGAHREHGVYDTMQKNRTRSIGSGVDSIRLGGNEGRVHRTKDRVL